MHATSCDVARAHEVAELMTRFCSSLSSVVLATFLALRTSWAVALATALARANNVSCNRNSNGVYLNLYFLNPTALRTAETLRSFGCSECNRAKYEKHRLIRIKVIQTVEL